jgi:hypothetical protein
MIDAVLLFGAMNIVFEFVLLSMMPPKYRLRVLGSSAMRNALHVLFLTLNLIVHWGTLIGSMSSIMAFIASMVTVRIAQFIYGSITDQQYIVGVKRYSWEELT